MHSHLTISTSHMYNFDIFSLGPNHSYFAQGIYLIDKTENIPCAILEWSDTILELRNQVGILTLRRAILEWYRFLLCAEHIQSDISYASPEHYFRDVFLVQISSEELPVCNILLPLPSFGLLNISECYLVILLNFNGVR